MQNVQALKKSVGREKMPVLVRGMGRGPGNKGAFKQILLSLDPEEWSTVEFFKEFTGQSGHKSMTAGQIMKASAVLGVKAFGYAVILAHARKEKTPERKLLDVLNEVLAESQERLAYTMQVILDEEIAEQTQLNL